MFRWPEGVVQSAWPAVVFGFWSLITLGGGGVEGDALDRGWIGECGFNSQPCCLSVVSLLLQSSVSLLGKRDHCEGEIK